MRASGHRAVRPRHRQAARKHASPVRKSASPVRKPERDVRKGSQPFIVLTGLSGSGKSQAI